MLKVILSGGGTGGHIYPAVSVAEELVRKLNHEVEILFVGAEGKMEMEKIPSLGYNIVGLPVAGLQRSFTSKNLSLPLKIIHSLNKARSIIKSFKPDIVVGFGGYASAPILRAAQRKRIPTIIQEQNSYAGLTNKILSRKADKICVAYNDMERFFRKDKIIMTGNPLRSNFRNSVHRSDAVVYFNLNPEKPTIFITGGSLGTRTLNNAVLKYYDELKNNEKVQLIWQTGKIYEDSIKEKLKGNEASNIWYGAFIDRMDYAYSLCDLVVARAGASTVSELCLLGKSVLFVPSPNVSEDHQTKNAMALVNAGAAGIIKDSEAEERVIPEALKLINDKKKIGEMSTKIKALGIEDSAERIVNEIMNLLSK